MSSLSQIHRHSWWATPSRQHIYFVVSLIYKGAGQLPYEVEVIEVGETKSKDILWADFDERINSGELNRFVKPA